MKHLWNSNNCSVFSLLACGVLLISISCDPGQEADTPTDKEYDEIASAIAPLISVELESGGILETSTHIAVGDEPGWLRFQSTGNLEGSVGGLTWDVLAECQSSQNDELEVCDETTDQARLNTSIAGRLDLVNYNAGLDVDSKWLIDGLQGSMITAKGTSQISADSDFDSLLTPVNRVYEFVLDLNFDFQIPVEDYEAAFGTAEATVLAYYSKTNLNGSDIAEGKFIIKAELALDGDGNALLTLDGTVQYRIDLATSLVVRIHNS